MTTLSRFGLALGLATLLAVRTASAADLLVDDFSAPTEARISLLTGLDEETLLDFDASVLGGVRGVYHHDYTNPPGSLSALSVGAGRWWWTCRCRSATRSTSHRWTASCC